MTAFLIACGGGGGATPTTPRDLATPAVDPGLDDVAPAAEIDGLLLGAPRSGRPVQVITIAVPPLEVRGGRDEAWLGEGLADIVLSQLSATRGVVAPDRSALTPLIDELHRKGSSAASLAKLGRAIAVDVIVSGSLVASNARGVLKLRAVRVATGDAIEEVTAEIAMARLDPAVREQTRGLMARLGIPAATQPPTAPLAIDRLSEAAHARQLQFAGKLLEAEPLYAHALSTPSSAWRFEADHLMLMSDLGLYHGAKERARRVLDRMPRDDTSICDRARIQIEMNREDLAVNEVREAVRLAASCGEPSLVAAALFHLAHAVKQVSYPAAREAITRAEALFGRGIGGGLRCRIEDLSYELAVGDELDTRGDPELHYAKIAQDCAAAGNLRYAAIASDSAADWAWDPRREIALRDQAVKYATVAGGQQLDASLLDSAAALRRAGRVSDADQRLLQMIGSHLHALIALHGALPQDAQKLDGDLLARAGVTRLQSEPHDPSGPDAPIARGHRAALATALRAWADRTRPESTRQAERYLAIAGDLEPGPTRATVAEQLERTYKLPLDAILGADRAPARNSGADVLGALAALRSWFHGTSKPDLRDSIRRAIQKLAAWHGSTRAAYEAAMIEISDQLARGEPELALAAIKAAEPYARHHLARALELRRREVEAHDRKQDRTRAIATREAIVELAKHHSAAQWIDAVVAVETARLEADPASYTAGADRLFAVAKELEARDDWEQAAAALAHAAGLINAGRHADGTLEAVKLYERRVQRLDEINDPLRSALAWADLLTAISDHLDDVHRDGAPAQLAQFGPATSATAHIATLCRRLVDQKRQRDAVRVVARLPPDPTGVDALVGEAMQWATSFEDSAEFPRLLARLHDQRGQHATEPRDKVAEFAASRDAYLTDKDIWHATDESSKMLHWTQGEDDLWAGFDDCIEMAAAGVDLDRADCVWGFAHSIHAFPRRVLKRADRLASVLERGAQLTAAVDSSNAIQHRMEWRLGLAAMAALVGNHSSYERWFGEVEAFYTRTSPDAAQWATALARLRSAIELSDPKLALDLTRKFYTYPGASSTRIATAVLDDARLAAALGDRAAETELLRHLRRAVAEQPRYASLPVQYEADRLFKQGQYAKAERAYGDAAQLVARDRPGETRLLRELELRAAVSAALQHKLAASEARLRKALDAARRTDPGSVDMPCFDHQLLDVSGGIAMAAGRCSEGAALKALAQRRKLRCTQDRCVAPGSELCDSPKSTSFSSTNACGRRFAIDLGPDLKH